MSRFGTCDAGCSEHKLELVRAAIYDSLVVIESSARIRAEAFDAVAEALASRQLAAEEWEAVYTAVQDDARHALRRHPDGNGRTVDCEKPPELAITWWCAECGGVDAPQPGLGICIWRPVELVNRSVYEKQRERAAYTSATEHRLRRLLRRVTSVRPHDAQWERTSRVLQAEAQETLETRIVAA